MGEGGALYISGAHVWAEISDCTFFNNTADTHGGALLVDRTCGPLVRNSSFISNTAGVAGGAVMLRLGEVFDTCTPAADILSGTDDAFGGVLPWTKAESVIILEKRAF